MTYVKLVCENCGKEFTRLLGIHNNNLKRGTKTFCSKECSTLSKTKPKPVKPQLYCIACQKALTGQQTKFCSRKCNASFSNKKNQSWQKQQAKGAERKIKFVNLLGGKCSLCGYNKNLTALEFHHINPDNKDSGLDMRAMSNRSENFIAKELTKCVLLCSNCHKETHNPDYNDWQ